MPVRTGLGRLMRCIDLIYPWSVILLTNILMNKTFADFELAESLQLALADLGFTTPTAVQEQAIPAALAGKDLLVSSQTGSGKTVAFLLPTLNPLADPSAEFVPFKERLRQMPAPNILVLCPTRELAQQVSKDAIKLVRHIRGLRVAAVMGGMPFPKQIQELKGAQVLVATPGRLLDLVSRRQLKLDQVDALIVDEADRMLDLGFSEDLEAISNLASNRKQTLMFSATFADRIIALASKMTNDPERIAIETGHSTNADVTQTLHWTDGFEHKKKLLSHWLKDETMDQVVVFASTQEDTDMLAEELAEAGHSVVALHGAMPQSVRNRRLRTIREGKAKILVATDVAARGLDVPTISHVINFGLPMKNEDYVHRVGRTGRAGRTGQAVTLATHRERSKIRALEDYLDTRLNVSEIEGLEPSPPPERSGPKRGGKPGGRTGGRSYGGSERRSYGDNAGGERRSYGDNAGGERRSYGGNDRFADDRRAGGFGNKRRVEGEGHFKREESRGPRRDGGNYAQAGAGEAANRFGGKPRYDENKPRYDDNKPRFADDRAPRREGDDRPRNFGNRFNDGERRPRPEGTSDGQFFNRDNTRGMIKPRDGEQAPRRFDDERRPRRPEGERSDSRFARHDNTERRFSQGEPRGERRYGGERNFNRDSRDGERTGGERNFNRDQPRTYRSKSYDNNG